MSAQVGGRRSECRSGMASVRCAPVGGRRSDVYQVESVGQMCISGRASV